MENVCPGLKYFNEVKDSIEKDPNAIYMLYGHGCDLYGELLNVPQHSKYITRIACGISATNDMMDINSIGKDFLNGTLNIDKLDKYEKVMNDTPLYTEEYRVHNPGDNYINNKNSCLLEWHHGFGGLSGLRKFGHLVPIPQLNLYSKDAKPYQLRNYLLMCYEGSLYPTIQQINKLLDDSQIFSTEELANYIYDIQTIIKFKKLIADTFSIDFATLMNVLPGTFINKSCRPICRGKLTKDDIDTSDKFIQLSRVNSNRKIYKDIPPNVQEKIDGFNSTPEIPFLPLSEIKKDLN